MHDLDEKYKAHLVFLTKDSVDILFKALDSVLDKQLYIPKTFTNYKIYIADTGSSDYNKDKIREYIKKNNHIDMQYIIYDGYHYGKVNNHVIKEVIEPDTDKENLLVLCNNDIQLLTDCITEFIEFYDKTDNAGTIGCKLLFENKSIQHAGQIIVSEENMFPTHRGLKQPYQLYPQTDEVVGNTGALLLMSYKLFLDIGGFNEDYDFCFEDLHLNMECLLKDKKNYYLGSTVAYHFESMNKERVGLNETKRNELAMDDYKKVYKDFTQKHAETFKPYVVTTP